MPEIRCQKCHRPLKATRSIVMKMGPKCAGISGGSGRQIGVRVQRKSGGPYPLVQIGKKSITLPLPLFLEDEDISACLRAASEPVPFDELLKLARSANRRKRIRQLRRERYENRKPFAPGMYTRPEHVPMFYEPIGDEEWQCSTDKHVISHERLGKYLSHYGRI